MPFDRAAALRNAEKLLRQGKLDSAIAEYARVVEEQPRDWNTANLLGDLHIRAGQSDKAVQQFTRIADHLKQEGFLPKAAALYKKVLKLRSDDEHSLEQSAEIAAGQGLLADARTFLNSLADLRLARGDNFGAAQAKIRLGSLDPADLDARAAAARARRAINDDAGALAEFKAIAADLAEKGRDADAVEAWRQAAQIDPTDQDIRERLLQVYLAAGDFARAAECAASPEHYRQIAAALDAAGRPDEALAMLREAARLAPADGELKAHLARAFVARGDLQAAAEYLTVETAAGDPQLLMTVAEIQLRAGHTDEGLAVIRRLIEEDPSRREAIALLSWNLAAQAPEPAFHLAEAAADASIAVADWPAAAAALQEYVTRVPNHIPALMRLVEICVDGGLEATMYSAQAQLADAYIAAGSASEARVIAEDLVAREPWERANIERFRNALVLLGEADPDNVIAERLSGQSPFTSTDLSVDFSDMPFMDDEPSAPAAKVEAPRPSAVPPPTVSAAPPATPAAAPPSPLAAAPPAAVSSESPAKPAAPKPPSTRKSPGTPGLDASSQFGLGVNAIDLGSILNEIEPDAPPPTSRAAHEHVEVDLSVVLNDIKGPTPAPTPAPQESANIDDVFARMREQASRQSPLGAAEQQYKRGLALKEAGREDDAIPELEAASRAPRFRFAAASLLARIHRERGRIAQAVEWLERAAQAPAPTPEEGHQLLYELGDALESEAEVARALAVFMELHADAGDYRDVAARVERLARVQTRG